MRIGKNTNPTITRTSSTKNTLRRILIIRKMDQIFLTTKEIFFGFILVPKKYHHYMFLKTNVVIKESLYSIKIKYILSTHFQDEHIFGIPQSHMDQKIATM